MGDLSFKSALSIIGQLDIYPEYQGVAGLSRLLSETTAAVPGAGSDSVSVLYSNMVGDIHASALAQAAADASGGRLNTFFQSGQGLLLNSSDFIDAFTSAAGQEGYSSADIKVLMSGGTLENGTNLIGGLWGGCFG